MALRAVGAEDDRRDALTEAEQLVRGGAAVEEQRAGDAVRIEQPRVDRVLETRVLDATQILQACRRFALGRCRLGRKNFERLPPR